MEKPQEEEPEKPNAESEVQSMVTVPIHQDTSSVPPITTPVINLTTPQSDSPTVHAPLPTSTATTTTITTTTTLPPPPPLPKQSTADLILLQCIGELEQHMVNLIQDKLALEERMFEDKSYEAHEDHKNLFVALQKSLERDYLNQLLADLDEARKKKRKKHDLLRTPSGSPPPQPPPPPPPASASGAPDYIRYESTGGSTARESSLTDSLMNDDSSPDKQVHLFNHEDTGNDHLPKADMRKD
ncbi:hypothetical protein Tco_1082951 [Tanacetum coccineum]|uniref:FRIGIDA-like protein n=1 Tax=Tanacetum coccineum TaxID=301880 RepID=A0ABQ5I325_9ASTR